MDCKLKKLGWVSNCLSLFKRNCIRSEIFIETLVFFVNSFFGGEMENIAFLDMTMFNLILAKLL